MDRKIVLSVLLAALFGFVGIWLLLSAFPDQRAGLKLYPWDASRDAAGRTRVFDLTLGESTLAELRALLGEDGTLSLFADSDGGYSVEAYFNDIMLSNLRADWVALVAVPEQDLEAMYDRGLRVSTLSSGDRKVKLDPDDAQALGAMPLRSLTYLPWKRLTPEDVVGRFGEPEQRISEPGGVVHWLYPARGMDIARDPDGGIVIQYLDAEDFGRAVQPLAPAAAGD